jgi:predicted dehydrogenase
VASEVRAAFIGAGNLANRRHYPSLTSLPDVDLAALCDLVPEKAEATAERWGVPRVYADYKQMLAQVDPQVVYVVMPPQHLFDLVMTALGQRRHVFIEKPPGLTTLHTRMFADQAERSGCLTMVGFQRRHIPAMTELRRRVEARGPIHTVAVSFLKSTRALDRHAGLYGGAIDPLTSDGIHAVDNLRWLAGGEVERVTSHVRTRYVPGPAPNAIVAQVEFSSGAVGQLHFSYVTGRRIFRAEIHGQNATASVDADRDSFIVFDDGEPEVFESRAFGDAAGGQEEHWLGFWHEARHFVDCIKEGRQPSSNFADAIKTMELVERLYQGR